MSQTLFADGWAPLLRIAIVGTLTYIAVVGLLRYFGKRALAKTNAFDIVITVAIGSELANAILSKDISLIDGVWALVVLLVLQRCFAALALRLGWFGRYLKAQPLLIIYRGLILWGNARKEHLGELEILGGVRSRGLAAVEDVFAMVLEPDGSFSVIPACAEKAGQLPTALRDVHGVPEFDHEEPFSTDRENVKHAAAG